MLQTSMPETTIYKYHEMFAVKNEIRFSKKFFISAPTSDFIFSEN